MFHESLHHSMHADKIGNDLEQTHTLTHTCLSCTRTYSQRLHLSLSRFHNFFLSMPSLSHRNIIIQFDKQHTMTKLYVKVFLFLVWSLLYLMRIQYCCIHMLWWCFDDGECTSTLARVCHIDKYDISCWICNRVEWRCERDFKPHITSRNKINSL